MKNKMKWNTANNSINHIIQQLISLELIYNIQR